MDKLKQERIVRFLNDKQQSADVYHELREFFLESGGERDVHMLAARKLAVDLLPKAWLRLESFRNSDSEPKEPTQIGL